MSFIIAHLPDRIDTAAANMADDTLLLENVQPGRLWLRFYNWSEPAFSFGVFQSLAWIKSQLPSDAPEVRLVRRPSGGGLVDHRGSWTYTVIVPAGHFLADGAATETYRLVHTALAETMVSLSFSASLVPCARKCGLPQIAAAPPTVCFKRPEPYDVLEVSSGRKIAGAALRRNRSGLLFQGSVETSGLGGLIRNEWEAGFAMRLSQLAGARLVQSDWPFALADYRRCEEQALFASEAWTGRR